MLRFTTTALDSMAPGSLNSNGSKAVFYVLNAAPEFLATAVLVSLNVRHDFGAGSFGDIKESDPKIESDGASK